MTSTATTRPAPAVNAVSPTIAGAATVVPPASVPLTFLAAAGVGLTGLGIAVALASDEIVGSPTSSGVVGTAHLAVLAFLTTAVLGALHQFGPVVGRRPLRSTLAARMTSAGMVLTAWLLPNGFAHGPGWLVPATGLLGAMTVLTAAWNLSQPLSSPDGGIPVQGLRISVAYLLVTVAFGVIYAFDRHSGWFPLLPHRVLAHAHLGLLGWLGLTYVSVAEKLWPMFLLAHRPGRRTGAAAVALLGIGTAIVAFGMLIADEPVTVSGLVVVVAGLACHLASLVSCVHHRRRRLELLHAYLFTSTGFLVAAVALTVVAGAADVAPTVRSRLVVAEVTSLLAWLGLAVVGHAHKIVPFIAYTVLRSRGVQRGPSGNPLLFSDLHSRLIGWISLVLTTAGFAAIVVGSATGTDLPVRIGGIGLFVGGACTTSNLAVHPLRFLHAGRRASVDERRPPTVHQPAAAPARPDVPTRRDHPSPDTSGKEKQ